MVIGSELIPCGGASMQAAALDVRRAILALATGVFLIGLSQAAVAQDECAAILSKDLMTQFHYTDMSRFDSDFVRNIKYSSEDLKRESTSGSISAPIAAAI